MRPANAHFRSASRCGRSARECCLFLPRAAHIQSEFRSNPDELWLSAARMLSEADSASPYLASRFPGRRRGYTRRLLAAFPAKPWSTSEPILPVLPWLERLDPVEPSPTTHERYLACVAS